jgi:hypothetical protein
MNGYDPDFDVFYHWKFCPHGTQQGLPEGLSRCLDCRSILSGNPWDEGGQTILLPCSHQ